MDFLKSLISEVASNGKLLTGYILTQIPGATSFPGVVTAFHTASTDQTAASYIDLAVQSLMLIAAVLKAGKIAKAANAKK